MTSDDLVSAFGLATRLRAHEVDWQLDAVLSRWLGRAQEELKDRRELDRVREFLPVYYDPSRRVAVFGPAPALASSAAIQAALQAVKPLRQIAG